MKRILLICAIIGFPFLAYSQDISVKFRFDSAQLDSIAMKSIAGFITEYQPNEIILQGYTDTTGSRVYNKLLAGRRLKSVEEIIRLKNPDIDIEKINNGEEKSLTGSNQENRKVEISLSELVYEQIVPQYKNHQLYQVSNQKDTIIICKEGSKIFIPENVFVTANGEKVSGIIDFRVTEYYTFPDMIAANLTTTANGHLLQTGGMLFLEAFNNNSEVFIAPGERIGLHFRDISEVDSMQLFKGEMSEDSINWIPLDTDESSENKYSIGVRPRFDDRTRNVNPYNRETDSIRAQAYEMQRQTRVVRNDFFQWPNMLGWINCDRFVRPYKSRINIRIKANSKYENYYAIMENKRIIIRENFYNINQKVAGFRNIPYNNEVIIVGIKRVNGKTYLSSFKVEEGKSYYEPDFKEIPEGELVKELEKIK